MNHRPETWRERALAASCYLGLLPVFRLAPRLRTSPFADHHYRQAAIIFAFLLLLVVALAAAMLGLSYLLVFHREFYEHVLLEGYVLGLLRKLLLAWAVFWAFGLVMAVLGGMRSMPVIQRLTHRDAAVATSIYGLCGLYAALLLLLPVAAHASSLVPESRASGQVYMVYEDNDIFPRWMFAVAFYRMALTAEEVYGPDSAVLLKISRETIAQALAGGKVVFVGSHGTKKGLMLKDDWIVPEDLAAVPKNESLSFVYLTGCDSGEQRDAWVAALAPAEVVTYDRLSASLEHAWWLWFRGPETIRAVHAEEDDAQ